MNDNLVQVYLSPQEVQRFESLIHEMEEVTGREANIVVRNTAKDIAREALKLTGKAEKKRLTRASFMHRQKNEGQPYWVVMKHGRTGKIVIFGGTEEQANKYGLYKVKSTGEYQKQITTGLMKGGWVAVLQKLGANIAEDRVKHLSIGTLVEKKGDGEYELVLSDVVHPISFWDSGRNRLKTPQNIQARTISTVMNKMESRLNDMANKVTK